MLCSSVLQVKQTLSAQLPRRAPSTANEIRRIDVLFLHDSRDCPETAVSLLHQKRLGSGSEPTKEKIKLLKKTSQVKIKHI